MVTALLIACWQSDYDVIAALIKHGADATMCDIEGRNMLHCIYNRYMCCRRCYPMHTCTCNLDAAQLLIAAGANQNCNYCVKKDHPISDEDSDCEREIALLRSKQIVAS